MDSFSRCLDFSSIQQTDDIPHCPYKYSLTLPILKWNVERHFWPGWEVNPRPFFFFCYGVPLSHTDSQSLLKLWSKTLTELFKCVKDNLHIWKKTFWFQNWNLMGTNSGQSVAGLLNKRLMLSSSFRCVQIYKYKIYDFGHTLLCYLSQT